MAGEENFRALNQVRLPPLMTLSSGIPEIAIGLVDGPVMMTHSGLGGSNLREVSALAGGACTDSGSPACSHGTFIAGILSGKRGSAAPSICPGCTLLIRPIFTEAGASQGQVPSATPRELAQALYEVIAEGARVVNLSLGLTGSSSREQKDLEAVLGLAARQHVLVIAAAGNQAELNSSVLTRHPWVIPVVAYGQDGNPWEFSNLANSIGCRGVGAPGESVTSLAPASGTFTLSGTSAAAPFVTGAIALLWSCFPKADAAEIKMAVCARRRRGIVPPLLDAQSAYQTLASTRKPARANPELGADFPYEGKHGAAESTS